MLSRVLNVAIAVNDIEAASKRFQEAFGWQPEGDIQTQEGMQIKIAMLAAPGITIELMSPLPGETVLRRFLDNRGEGVYRIAFGSDDIDGVLSHFDQNAVKYVDMSAQAALGSRVVFTHPKSTHGLMIEVVEGR